MRLPAFLRRTDPEWPTGRAARRARRSYFARERSSGYVLDQLLSALPDERDDLYLLLASNERECAALHDTAFGPDVLTDEDVAAGECTLPAMHAYSAALFWLLAAVEVRVAAGDRVPPPLSWAGVTEFPEVEQAAAPVLDRMVAAPERRLDLLVDLRLAVWDVVPGQGAEGLAAVTPPCTLWARVRQSMTEAA